MKKRLSCGTLVLLLFFMSVVIVRGQMPQQVQLVPRATFHGVSTPARYFYLVQAVIEYGPGTFSAAGSEQSVRFFTILESELTFTIGHRTDVYAAGKSFMVPPGTIVRSTNEGRMTNARVFVSSLVPAWEGRLGAVIVPGTRPSSTPPRTVYSWRLPVGPLPEVIDVIQGVTRWDPGAVTGTHVMNEVHGLLHLEGVMSYEYLDGLVETYGPGQGAQMYVGRPGVMGNRSTAPAVLLITYLATPGMPLTSPWPNS